MNAFDLYALCAVLLFLKMLAISVVQGWYRIGRLAFHNPEDAAFVGRAPAGAELPQVRRAQRAWGNDLENIPIFLILGGIALARDAAPALLATLFAVFTLARIAHTACYLCALQPWRTLAYAIGLLCTLSLCALIGASL